MLSQEELDKLLEDGPEEAQDKAEEATKEADSQTDSGGEAAMSQDELDKLLEQEAEGGGKPERSEDLDWEDAFKEAASGGDPAAAKQLEEGTATPQEDQGPEISAREPSFSEFSQPSQAPPEAGKPDLDFILDIPLQVSVELGRARLQIRDLLQLGQGSVVELNKMAGEPAEIYVNNKLMAKGEVVVINEKFGVRLTEIISPTDRVKSLG